MRAAMVWPKQLNIGRGPLAEGAHIGTHLLHVLAPELELVQWEPNYPPADLAQYDVFFVNLFTGEMLIHDIRKVKPSAFVVAIPDSAMDEVFLNRDLFAEQLYLSELSLADAIGVVSESNAQFYSVFGKPILRIPMPIGTPDFIAQCRMMPKEDYIIAIDHGDRAVNQTIQQVAALALIQREFKLPVKYVHPSAHTVSYAEELGLEAEFLPYLPGHVLWALTARAQLALELFTLHGAGRHEIVCAAVGTPCIGSSMTGFKYSAKVEPWHIQNALERARWLLDPSTHGLETTVYQDHVGRGLATVDLLHSFPAVTKIMHKVLQEVETLWQRSPR